MGVRTGQAVPFISSITPRATDRWVRSLDEQKKREDQKRKENIAQVPSITLTSSLISLCIGPEAGEAVLFRARGEEEGRLPESQVRSAVTIVPVASHPHAWVRRATEQGPTGAKGASWANVSGLVDLSEKGRKNEKDTTKLKCVRSLPRACVLMLTGVLQVHPHRDEAAEVGEIVIALNRYHTHPPRSGPPLLGGRRHGQRLLRCHELAELDVELLAVDRLLGAVEWILDEASARS